MSAAARMVVEALREAMEDDQLRGEVAALLVEVFPQPATTTATGSGWLDSAAAAAYLGTTRNALHKATAARTVRFEQECPGGRCWFRREDLDAWRRGRPR
jgi:hypothetical protein